MSNVSLAVLAGGAGRRMGGPKAMLRVEGKPILAWLIERWNWPGPTMLVTTPSVGQPPGAELFDRTVIDPVDGLGPLRGTLTALENATTPIICFATVDMPAVGTDQFRWLAEHLGPQEDVHAMMCKIISDGREHVEPFPSAFRVTAASTIRRRLESGRRSVNSLCDIPSFIAVAPPADWSAQTWTNLNEPVEFERFTSGLGELRRRPTGDNDP